MSKSVIISLMFGILLCFPVFVFEHGVTYRALITFSYLRHVCLALLTTCFDYNLVIIRSELLHCM
jgi:hypothetical protein